MGSRHARGARIRSSRRQVREDGEQTQGIIMERGNSSLSMEAIASDDVMDAAYAWLCDRRKDYSPNNDVWHLRWRWSEIKPQIQAALRAGTYRLGAVTCFQAGEETREVWAARDALVLPFELYCLGRCPVGLLAPPNLLGASLATRADDAGHVPPSTTRLSRSPSRAERRPRRTRRTRRLRR